MTDVDDLIRWHRAQLAEDEEAARAAADYGDVWRAGSGKTAIYPSDESRHPGPIIIGPYGDLEEQHTDHIVRWDPARVLAEVDADRALLDAYEEAAAYYRANPNAPAGELHGLLTAIKHRAAVHAHRPGYREEWRPQ